MEALVEKIISYDHSIHGDRTEYVLSALYLVYGNLFEDIQVVNNVATVTIMQGFYSIIIESTKIKLEDHTTKKAWTVYDVTKMIGCNHVDCAKEHEDWQKWLEFDIFMILHDIIQILYCVYNMNIGYYPSPDSVMCLH